MTQAHIKGTLFEAVVEDLERVIDEGRLTREGLEARVEATDLALLEGKIYSTSWYDILAYHRFVDILCDAEGGGQPSYWFTRGERAAKRLTDRGIYQQLEYLGRTASSRETEPAARFKAFAKDMRLLMSLHSAMLDFGQWDCVVDPDRPDRYRVEISGIAGVPDGIFMAAAGLFSALGRVSRGEAATSWFFDRASPDLALLRMTSAI